MQAFYGFMITANYALGNAGKTVWYRESCKLQEETHFKFLMGLSSRRLLNPQLRKSRKCTTIWNSTRKALNFSPQDFRNIALNPLWIHNLIYFGLLSESLLAARKTFNMCTTETFVPRDRIFRKISLRNSISSRSCASYKTTFNWKSKPLQPTAICYLFSSLTKQKSNFLFISRSPTSREQLTVAMMCGNVPGMISDFCGNINWFFLWLPLSSPCSTAFLSSLRIPLS